MKRALITGVTGQDGYYLSKFLLENGYKVYGMRRRVSGSNTDRLKDLLQKYSDRFILRYGDLTDSAALNQLVKDIRPDEVYNLGAQSHVGVSFETPVSTADIDALGTLRVLEAIRQAGLASHTRFYQASTSELYGKVEETPQNEKTPFHPRSPYGVAKLFAFWAVRNYREAYNMYACNGVLFNHETVAEFMPMFCKYTDESEFDIKPISEIVEFDKSLNQYQSKPICGISVLGKSGWVKVTHASAYPHDIKNDNKKPRFINARCGAVMATASHVGFLKGGIEKEFGKINIGDDLETIDFPQPEEHSKKLITKEEAELLGMLVADGSVTYRGNAISGKFTKIDKNILDRFTYLWNLVTGGTTIWQKSYSGFKPGNIVGQLRLIGGSDWLKAVDIYNKDRTKRIPKCVLNAPQDIMLAFLHGYNVCDGLKANLCTYEFKNFKTNSATLALGLWYLVDCTTKQTINLTVETKPDGRLFYSLNLLSPNTDKTSKIEAVNKGIKDGLSQRKISELTGVSRTFIRKIQQGEEICMKHYLKKPCCEVKKIIEMPEYKGWFFDLETESGEFHCGVGNTHVHNSPLRGTEFVTRKITLAVANIIKGKQDVLYLGNIDAKRDWGFAGDYVRAMHAILQQEKPDDYVIATGETHTVREFIEIAFKQVGIKIEWIGSGVNEIGIDSDTKKKLVAIDPAFYRPAEVDLLIGDPRKAATELGWKREVNFESLVSMMVEADLQCVR